MLVKYGDNCQYSREITCDGNGDPDDNVMCTMDCESVNTV